MPSSEFSDYLLTRQPILDLQEELVGYAISLRATPDDAPTGKIRSATLICAAYAEFGLRTALGPSKAFIPADTAFLLDDAIEALPPEAVVIELTLDAPPDNTTLERCRTLRDRRYKLALDNYGGLDDRSGPLLGLVDIVKIDTTQTSPAGLAELAGPLAKLPMQLMATGVDSQDKMQRCRALGFHLFRGYYFARPELISGRRLSASQAGLIQLINLAGRDADSGEIEEGIKREPALAINLLRIVNSAGYGMTRRITSLRNAITILGRRQLQRWLQLLLMAPAGKTADLGRSPLLQVAALRGRMMELISAQRHSRDARLAEQAFITGIMSMMPAALGLPLAEILEQIVLDPEVASALSGRGGALGQSLALLESFDNEDIPSCDRLMTEIACPSLTRQALNASLAEALRWLNAAPGGI